MSWVVDGFTWDIPCDIERTAEVKPSEISGLMLDKTYFNDVIGTYMSYDISLAVPYGWENSYNSLYEILSNPIGWHTFTLPYGNRTVTIVGRIANVRDVYLRLYNGTQHWNGIKFTIISNNPTKEMSLSEVIEYGMPAKPDAQSPTEGDVYIYTNGAWTRLEYTDADEVYY